MMNMFLHNTSRNATAVAFALMLVGLPQSDLCAQDPMTGMDMPGSGMSMPAGPLGISMDRMGSGTTWIPDAVTLPSRHAMAGGWSVMLHGFVFGQYNRQSGARGDEQIGSLNWGMVMASRPLGGGTIQLRTMLSLDPATVTARGYPLLLQSGEAYHGAPLHDRQHPHDFLMEVAALYERQLASNVAMSVYGAPSGEPALGPVAFMHRPSAMDDPVAPIGHHWQDATHIAFGVVTAGMFTRGVRIEGSLFNGREPDDRRWNIDRIHLDSYSARITLSPDSSWSFTVGHGYLKSPEALEPDSPMRRWVLSALHGTRVGTDGQWSSAMIYGANRHVGQQGSQSVLVESELLLDRRNTVFGRAEFVEKSGEELVVDGPPFAFDPKARFDVGHVSLGYIREVGALRGATLGLGIRGTMNVVPAALEPVYGSRTPLGVLSFVRVRPAYPARAPQPPADHVHPPPASRPR